MDFRLTVGLTIGEPEVVGAFANCFFQIWHGIFPINDMPSPDEKSCARKVNEILKRGVRAKRARVRTKGRQALAPRNIGGASEGYPILNPGLCARFAASASAPSSEAEATRP